MEDKWVFGKKAEIGEQVIMYIRDQKPQRNCHQKQKPISLDEPLMLAFDSVLVLCVVGGALIKRDGVQAWKAAKKKEKRRLDRELEEKMVVSFLIRSAYLTQLPFACLKRIWKN